MLPTKNLSSVPHLPIGIDLNVIDAISNLKTEPGIRCRRRKFISTQDEEIRKSRVLRHQNTVKRRGRLEDLAHSDPEYAKALDVKECMLEVQGMLLGKLAAEETHLRGLAVLPTFSITDFEERITEIEEATSIPKLGNKKIEQPTGATLQAHYDEFMALDQARPAMIGSDNKEEPNSVAIKRMKKANKNPVDRIKSFTSDHLVQIKNMFEDGDDIVIIYETMDVTLRQLTGILRGPLKAFQIAAICNEVLDGLSYLHNELARYHGALSCETILLDLDGRVKPANIGESFVKDRRLDPESKTNDICSVGSVMMGLIEPETFILEPQSIILKNAHEWKDGLSIKDFLAATQYSALETLKNVSSKTR